MDPIDNPYTPNAGAQPPAIMGRDEELNTFRVLIKRRARGKDAQSMIITGLRGVGKTVLLGQFREIALEENWVIVEDEVGKHTDEDFRRRIAGKFRTALFELSPRARWTEKMQRAAAVLKSFSLVVDPTGSMTFGADVDAAEGFADNGDLQADLTDLVVAVGEAAKSAERGVVLLLDEVQFLTQAQLESLIAALHKAVQRKLPVTMVGAGLPQIAELAGDAKSYSERLFKFPRIGNLNPDDAFRALSEPAAEEQAQFEKEALSEALTITEGYPYFLQELGSAVWPIAQNGVITRNDILLAVDAYTATLDESFFRVRLDRTTDKQRQYLRAMASLGSAPQKAADVAAAMDRSSAQVALTRSELIAMGLLYSPEYGYAAFTVPHFDKFMLRAIPVLTVSPIKPRKRKK